MDQALYLQDAYAKEFSSEVESVKDGKFVVLKETLFYPQGGGQPCDTGTIIGKDGTSYKVIFTGKFEGHISHEVDKPGLQLGEKIKGILDWEKRYAHMRNHTAAHILSGVIFRESGALITGNQIGIDKTRIDFSLESFSKEQMETYIAKANEIIESGLEVRDYALSNDEAQKIGDIMRLAKGLPPGIKDIRVVDIVGFDKQPDGGTHVKNTKEVGKLELLNVQNKGAANRRVYFRVI